MVLGGSIGIRTLETVPRLHTFQACAFDHSATDPLRGVIGAGGWVARGDTAKKAAKIGALQQGQSYAAVLTALLFDLADFHTANLACPGHMGASAGLQINLIRAQPDAD